MGVGRCFLFNSEGFLFKKLCGNRGKLFSYVFSHGNSWHGNERRAKAKKCLGGGVRCSRAWRRSRRQPAGKKCQIGGGGRCLHMGTSLLYCTLNTSFAKDAYLLFRSNKVYSRYFKVCSNYYLGQIKCTHKFLN